ncbi:hypothetical protein GCM10027605_17570 [Micromonospora zhanjiangensis]
MERTAERRATRPELGWLELQGLLGVSGGGAGAPDAGWLVSLAEATATPPPVSASTSTPTATATDLRRKNVRINQTLLLHPIRTTSRRNNFRSFVHTVGEKCARPAGKHGKL